MRKCYLALIALVGIGCGGDTSGPAKVATVQVQQDSVIVVIGLTSQLEARALDQSGTVLTGQTITWTSADQNIATVSNIGLVRGVAAGRVIVRAASGSARDSAVVVVTTLANDFGIASAQFTQAMQAADGSIPIVLGGNAAAVNVLITTAQPNTTPAPVQVVLRLLEANGTPIRTDTVLSSNPIGQTATYAVPSAQFLVQSSVLRAGMRWQVEVDPRHVINDPDRTNNVFPRTGPTTLATATVPALKVRFLPIVLAAHGNSTVAVTAAQVPEYTRVLRAVHPLGTITTTIGTAFTTSASFGTPPSGGAQSFWTQVLSELDMARVADGSDPEVHWFGLMRPPTGFNFTTFGGFGYIPSSGQATGSSTRTALAVAPGWFNNQAQSRELVAHELGHNFTRRHAPCGAPANPDVNFPQSNGTIGIPGHDVFSWASGLTASAVTMDASTGDVMGYCIPSWISEYTYRGVLNARGSTILAAPPQSAARARVLIVRGHIANTNNITLEPAFTLEGRPTRPERDGRYLLEGRDAAGRILFTHSFEPAEIDHAPNIRAFTFAIETTEAIDTELASLEVRGAGGSTRIQRSIGTISNQRPSFARVPNGLALRCPDAGTRGIAVLDANTGALLTTANSPQAVLQIPTGTRLIVACSDGIRTVQNATIAP